MVKDMTKATDSRRARSEVTQQALMRAAEKLIADQGVENVSIRDIVSAARQKNESALQYHFGSLGGLLEAIRNERGEQVRHRRAVLLQDLLATTSKPSLRQLCRLMVEPTFQLARTDAAFRRYIKAFGHELAHIESSPLKAIASKGGGGEAGAGMARLLKAALPQLDKKDYLIRMDAAVLLCSSAMYHQARQTGAFRGPKSDLFLESLIDALFGLLGAPVSSETQAQKKQ